MPGGLARETLHFHRPVAPLTASVLAPALERAFNATVGRESGLRIRLEVHEGYVYTGWERVAPQAPTSEADAPELGELAARWRAERLPELERALDELRATAAPTAAPRRAAAELERVPRTLERLLALHYDTMRVAQGANRMMADLLRGAGDERADVTVALLLAPVESRLREVDAWLAELARLVHADPRLAALLDDAPGLVAGLTSDPGEAGALFRRGWPRVAERPSLVELGAPTWREDPAPFARALRAAGPDAPAEFERGTRRALQRRAEAEADVRARLPPGAAEQLAPVLRMLRDARGVAQTVNHLVGELAVGCVREAYVRAGARLAAAGMLSRADDVALLAHDEVLHALREGVPTPGVDVEARRKALAAAQLATPPAYVGEEDPRVDADPALAALLGFAQPDAQESAAGGALQGLGASPGRACGVARLVRDEADLAEVRGGDVLVLLNLPPAWTPVMGKAVAVVTETGGMLAHAAIVAREMGLPAVVGVTGALERLRSGMRVCVDGDSGRIEPQ